MLVRGRRIVEAGGTRPGALSRLVNERPRCLIIGLASLVFVIVIACAQGCSSMSLPRGAGTGGGTGTGGSTGTGGTDTGGSTGTGGSDLTDLRACDLSGVDAFGGAGITLQRPDGTTAGNLGPALQGASENDTIMGTLGAATTVDVPCVFVGCVSPSTPEVSITVTDQGGQTWTLLAGSPADVAGWLPELAAAAGAPVVLTVLFERRFQSPTSAGFTLSDDAGVIVAAETGPNLDTGVHVDGLSVTDGAKLCSLGSSCGGSTPDTISYRVFTTATGSITLGASPDGEIQIGTRSYGARNSGGIVHGSCPQGSDPVDSGSFWMVWRLPPP